MRYQEVWKFTPLHFDRSRLELPKGAKLLHLDVQDDRPRIWVLVDPEAPVVQREIYIAGTGHSVPARAIYVDTCSMYGGSLVLHLFDLGET